MSVLGLSVLLAACAGNAVAPGATNNTYGNKTLNGASYSDAMTPDHQGPAKDVTVEKANNQAAALASRKPPIKPARPKKTAAIPFVQIKAASLANLDGKKVEAKLGKPEMQRGEGAARVWQYRSDRCALDVFFYPQGNSKKPVLVHMLARLRNGDGKIDLQECLDEIVKSRGPHQG
ncbi:hypothetical protein [Thalassospira sp. TSL5-1]|uniref:hypothetical protein n=1 Tax=Thalassospira sp. TSL5-1 TaxID=1544451 RepID=UPI000960A2F9|nr:hypothetical protein [Thalassospira sp. TSL5-1]OKH87341.1 hypothetical protein LF95_10960 [Thalassospira sp. TSL5-1]